MKIIWCGKKFGINLKYIGDYHNHLKKDVLFLADVFEKFFNPCHYFSSPGLNWDAMLKMTSVKLEKISDIDKYLFIEKGLRGRIAYFLEVDLEYPKK